MLYLCYETVFWEDETVFDYQPLMADDFVGKFSFLYDGKCAAEMLGEPEIEETESGVNARFRLPDGVEIVQKIVEYPQYNAVDWVLEIANTGTGKSGQISALRDADFEMGFDAVEKSAPGLRPNPDGVRVLSMIGSDWIHEEFNCTEKYLPEGEELRYACTGGRSSNKTAPFFDVNQAEGGMILAIGWTGQWNARFNCTGETVRVQTGLEDTDFYLEPGERIRTSSILILKYEDGQNEGHNAFRRLIKEHYSIIGKPGRPEEGPLCTSMWGSVPSDVLADRINIIAKEGVAPEYFWIDAGWYGYSDEPCPNEFTGDWGAHTGSWVVNKNYHPDGFQDVRQAIREAGKKFVLWVEPERVLKDTDMPKEHPEWFLSIPGTDTLLIDYGNPAAVDGVFEMLDGLIGTLEIDCYRQDFNTDPLPYWRANDKEGRKGMLEIGHIMGMYDLWDRLLEKYPHMIIDNCASGGRRIDIETLKRSIPLWRSDYQCTYDADPETAQQHMNGISWFLPYSGTGMGRVIGDIYRARSCYSAAMVHSFWFQLPQKPDPATQDMQWIRDMYAEYLRARPYFSADFYPLTRKAMDDTAWMIYQFDRPEQEDGMILAFRRPESPCPEAQVQLQAIDGTYEFEFVDSQQKVEAEYRMGDTFGLYAAEKRSSLLVFYRRTGD